MLWVRKKTGFAVTTLTSTQEADSFLRKRSTAAFGYFEKLEVTRYVIFFISLVEILEPWP